MLRAGGGAAFACRSARSSTLAVWPPSFEPMDCFGNTKVPSESVNLALRLRPPAWAKAFDKDLLNPRASGIHNPASKGV
jgi:hypothetical protein